MSECTHDCSTCGESCASREPQSLLKAHHPEAHVGKVYGIVSGKGGVGKSMVTSQLAVAMRRRGYNVGIMDADITGPSIPKAFGIHDHARGYENTLLPVESKTGIQVMSINLLLENETDPVIWRGPVISGVVQQFWTEVLWNCDYLFVDMPPGTGDVSLSVFQSIPLDGIIIVASPQELVSMVVEKAVRMAEMMEVPIVGLVENMSYVACPDCGRKIYLFGQGKTAEAAKAHKVFGYYIEVSNAFKELVPETYIRKQTLVNGERFITQELKDLEHEILTASERVVALEYELFSALRQRIADSAARIQKTAVAVAECDALCSFAAVAVHNNFCRPEVDESGVIEIREGRHPVVEKVLKDSLFVPNDTFMGEKEERVAIITGPNMAGKSTYMRQVALIVLMAQMGSFVPAKYAHIGVVDRIFTRIGASDDLSAGQSTFMVEMTEVSDILHQATKNSLLILDEIGRGTSTFDGMAIARAVLEYCADKKTLGAKTLFATHYHELTEMENTLPGTVNYNIAVKRRGEDIIFLRKIVPGGADRSYGIEVAKLAGLPDKVVQRAKIILKELEEENGVQYVAARKETDQVSLDAIGEGEVLDAIRRCQPDTLTPIEAMGLLYELKQKLSK